MKNINGILELKVKNYFNPITLINVWIFRNFKCDKEPAVLSEDGSILRYKGHCYELISQSRNHSIQRTKCKYCGKRRTLYF